jgi:arylsulfatase I/J
MKKQREKKTFIRKEQNAKKRKLPLGKKPHFLFILADDLGFHDLGYQNSEILTPTLDALANEGVKLNQYYVQSVCTPTRVQFMTGRYQIRSGMQHAVIRPPMPSGKVSNKY